MTMNSEDYTLEQREDIEKRVNRAKDSLKDLQLQPAVIMQPINLGDDVFGMKPIPYLQDIKYKNVLSPIQNP